MEGFQSKTDLLHLPLFSLSPNYCVENNSVSYKGELVSHLYNKKQFCLWLTKQGIDWDHLAPCLFSSAYIIRGTTLFAVEVIPQSNICPDDENLMLCDFKRKQYLKLLSPLNMEVEYIYILNDWFRNPKYKDVLDYIISVNCKYYFNYLPLEKIGLPVPA